MTYNRVIPRDLFNDANLLKCYGQIYLNLETLNLPDVFFDMDEQTFEFSIVQNEDDGSTYISNVMLFVRDEVIPLRRPLNSREPWPLYADNGQDEIPVFTSDGTFTSAMVALLKGDGD